MLVILTHF